MALPRFSSPHAHGPARTSWVMQQVLLASVPGVLALTVCFGWGTLANILWAAPVALACEAAMLRLRGRELRFSLRDCSALVTALLLAIALPPGSPWWLVTTGTAFAIVIAKHLYGGLGSNPFNPAMAGYVVLLISFPLEMTRWMAPAAAGIAPTLGPLEALQASLGMLNAARLDALTMATPLDVLRQNQSLLVSELWAKNPQFGRIAGAGWEWVNAGFLAGGLYLLARRIFTWHAPLAMLGALALMVVGLVLAMGVKDPWLTMSILAWAYIASLPLAMMLRRRRAQQPRAGTGRPGRHPGAGGHAAADARADRRAAARRRSARLQRDPAAGALRQRAARRFPPGR